MIDVSLIIPFYNSEKEISKLLFSLTKIRKKDLIELIFVNDGSTDNSKSLVESFIEDNNIGTIVNLAHNGGLAKARLQGFKRSRGNYIMFIDSDDYISEDHVFNIIPFLGKYDLIINSLYEVYPSGKTIITDMNESYPSKGIILEKDLAIKELLENKNLCSYFVTKTVKRSLLDELIFNWKYPYEDVARMHILFDRANSFYRMNKPTYYYVHRSGSLASKKNNAKYRYLALVERYKYFNEKENGVENYCLVPLFDSFIDLTRYNKKEDYLEHIQYIRKLYKKKKRLIKSKFIKKHMDLILILGYSSYHLLINVILKAKCLLKKRKI